MHLVIYTSEYTGDDANLRSDVDSILYKSHINNAPSDITGVFFQCGRKFLQFIEGETSDVQCLVSRIKTDRRHTNIEVLFNEPVSGRAFPAWSMDYSEVESNVEIDSEQLRKIVDAYQQNLQCDASALASVVKGIINGTAVTQ